MPNAQSPDWTQKLLENLHGLGPEAEATLHYINERGTKLSVHDQPTGARWTIDRRIEINPRFAQALPNDVYAISLVIHEVRHLQQGMLKALSVYGELDAWQVQFRFLKEKTGRYHSDPLQNAVLEELVLLPLAWQRRNLEQARELMQKYAGKKYRIDLLPLYPLPAEIYYRVTRKQPANQVSQN